ncbi:hypothetical protein AXG93_2556s1070 [Marchantia polymorpha subsp. ruderalis]|uniref:F-box domain-containing protein n=1 Tax=Marchantia polymorpha subsp. ruderalis TaxID=1480154 RepID=A0A176VGC0_MARPO|nr:hypothetical protein AXG93_2556s1070 [Marchantia polymorpha subsp. ruderalis]
MVTGRGEGAAAQWAGASWPRAAGNGINGGGSSGARARPGTPPQARGHKPQKLERASRPDEAPARDKKLRVQGGALARSPRAARPPPKEVGQAPQQAPPPQAPGPHPSEAASQPASQQAPTRGGSTSQVSLRGLYIGPHSSSAQAHQQRRFIPSSSYGDEIEMKDIEMKEMTASACRSLEGDWLSSVPGRDKGGERGDDVGGMVCISRKRTRQNGWGVNSETAAAMLAMQHQHQQQFQQQQQHDESCKLPDHLIESVLARLPLQSFFRFRAVCSSWNSYLYSNTFLKAYSEAGNRLCIWFLVVTANLGRSSRYGQRVVATYDPEYNNWHRIPLPAPLCDLNPYPTAADGGLMAVEDPKTNSYLVFVAGMVPAENGGDSLTMERSLLITYDMNLGVWNRICAPLPHTLGYEELVHHRGHVFLVGVLEENYKIESVCIWELQNKLPHRGPFKLLAYDLPHKTWRRLPESFHANECRTHTFIEGIIYEPRLDVEA